MNVRIRKLLGDLAYRFWVLPGGKPVLLFPSIDYGGLVDTMFHMIRQNAAGSAAVLIRIVEVLTAVIGYECAPARMAELRRHADLVLGDGDRDFTTPAQLENLRDRHCRFLQVQRAELMPRAKVAAG